jgi:hypothetical protein
MRLPWSDWIPGVLSKRQVLELCHQGYLIQTGSEPSVDHSSIDLHLSDEGFLPPQSHRTLGEKDNFKSVITVAQELHSGHLSLSNGR